MTIESQTTRDLSAHRVRGRTGDGLGPAGLLEAGELGDELVDRVRLVRGVLTDLGLRVRELVPLDPGLLVAELGIETRAELAVLGALEDVAVEPLPDAGVKERL
jgi:hypothetical protein